MGRPAAVIERLQQGRLGRLVKFGAVSAVSIVLSQSLLALFVGVMRLHEQLGAILSASISTLPAFQLSRRWVWRKQGSSHMTREVLPFWFMALLGLALSTFVVGITGRWARHHIDVQKHHLTFTLVVMLSQLAAYGVLWLVRFFVLDHLVFHEREVI
jgi:putative flippase GtrA